MRDLFLASTFLAPRLDFPGAEPTALIVLRWIHLVAGITWVGLLYFFNLVNVPFMQDLDAKQRSLVVPKLMPRALWWFRWSAVVTVLVGIAYWNHIVATDARNAIAMGQTASAGGMIGSFFVIWTLAFAVEMGALMSPAEVLRKGPVLGIIVSVAVVLAAYIFLSLNQQGWESNRALAIGIGGGLGWFMMLNVWGIIWRMQKKMIRWSEENGAKGTAMPPEAAKLARLTLLCSRVNFWLSFPMLFFMGAASHYIIFAGR
ncbi:MAG: urate hydroxylase PuuD [Candidatus Korobacteraceae bacterium]